MKPRPRPSHTDVPIGAHQSSAVEMSKRARLSEPGDEEGSGEPAFSTSRELVPLAPRELAIRPDRQVAVDAAGMVRKMRMVVRRELESGVKVVLALEKKTAGELRAAKNELTVTIRNNQREAAEKLEGLVVAVREKLLQLVELREDLENRAAVALAEHDARLVVNEEALKELGREIVRAVRVAEELGGGLSGVRGATRALEAYQLDVEGRMRSFEDWVKTATDRGVDVESRMKAVEVAMGEVRGGLVGLDELKRNQDGLVRASRELGGRVSGVEGEVKAKLEGLQGGLDSLWKSHEEGRRLTAGRIDAVEDDFARMRRAVEDRREDHGRLRKDHERLAGRVAEESGKSEAVAAEMARQREEHERLAGRVAEEGGKREAVAGEIMRLREDFERQKGEAEERARRETERRERDERKVAREDEADDRRRERTGDRAMEEGEGAVEKPQVFPDPSMETGGGGMEPREKLFGGVFPDPGMETGGEGFVPQEKRDVFRPSL